MTKLFALAGMAALALFASPRADAAGTAIKPYIVLILDTSGSMKEATGSGPPSCGGVDTKLNHARCAINKIASSNSDVVFALGRFRQVMGGTTTALNFPGTCCTSGPDAGANGACAAGIVCNATNNQFELLTPLIDGNNADVALWTNGTGNTCTAVGSDPEIWNADSTTPLEGVLNGVKTYWQGLQETNFTVWPAGGPGTGFNPIVNDPFANVFQPSGAQCRPYIVILLTDGDETCGGTPMNGAASLLTTVVGGKTYRILTKPIGFGTPVPYQPMEDIAHGGGAVDVPGQNEAFYASDEAGVELVVNQIVDGSVRFELCNGVDDNCNGLIDEDFPNKGSVCDNGEQGVCKRAGAFICTADGTGTVCNAPVGAPGVEICNGLDDDCDGVIDGITQNCSNVVTPGGPASDNPGTTAACMAEGSKCLCQPGQKDCPMGGTGVFGACTGEVIPTPEICNGLDDDCDGKIDEGTSGASCSANCGIGTEVCLNGVLTCNSVPATSDATCDNIDDDCDGKIDEDYVPVPCDQGGTVCNGMTKCAVGVVQCDGQPCISQSTTTLVSSSPSAAFGAPVTFTATVTATATGTVTFFDGTTSLGTGTVNANTATLATSTLAVGTHEITATYGGDASFSASTSAPLTQTITQETTTTTLEASPNPSGIGQAVVFTATVAVMATGTVTFVEGTTTLGTGQLGASGTATFSTSSLATGVHVIVAQYGGDTAFAASNSTALQQTVSGATDYAIAASPTTLVVKSGASVSTTLTITPTNGFTGALALSCTALPADAACAFAPAMAVLDGSNTPVPVLLTIETEMTMAQASPSRPPGGGRCALMMLGSVGVFARRRRRKWGARALLLFGLVTACGGDSTHRTPVRTYSITVDATGSMNHAVTISLVVEYSATSP